MAAEIEHVADDDLYRTDFYLWTKRQADHLRAGRFGDLDLARLIEEVEDPGEALHRSARSRLRTIMEHLLKLQHSPARNRRAGWCDTVLVQRDDLRDELTPTLRRLAEAALPDLYAQARKRAATSLQDHSEDAAADRLPKTCPYSFDDVTGDWLP